MIKKEENKRKGIIYLVIGVVTLLLLVSGVAYAYFQAQNDDGKSANLDATTGTTDVLSFLMTDIDTTDGNVIDNHNRDSENENEKIVINATQDNFGQNDKSLGDGVSAKAILKANNTNNIAEQKYNVFFVIEEPRERLIYTQDENHPELILTVIDPTGTELKNIEGLKYHNADPDNSNDVSGFDITGRVGSFAIVKDYKIEVEEGNGNHQTEQEWKIKVTLVNLKENQNNNTGKEINGEVVITQDEIETYKLNEIKNINVDNKTTSSITTTLELEEKPTNKAVEYYFAKEEKGRVSRVAVEELVWEKELTPTHTFTELKSDTNYIIYSYVVDSEGFRSKTYTTELIATEKKLPKITKLEVTDKSYNEISVKIESEEGDRGIKEYEYEISGATIPNPIIEKDTAKTHTFKDLEEQEQYTIKVRAVDNDGDKSTDSTKEDETLKKTIGLVCKGQEMINCIKENYELDEAIIYHNLEDATAKGFENYSLVANDNSYRYSGASEEVNNFICLDGKTDGKCESIDDLYRIIGLFPNEVINSDYDMKLIKYDYTNDEQTGGDGVGAYFEKYLYATWYYKENPNNIADKNIYSWNSATYTNDWSESNLNKINLNETFYNYLITKNPDLKSKIIKRNWPNSLCSVDSCTKSNANITYQNELTDNVTSNYIGLLYLSEYYYAAPSSYWNLNGYNPDSTQSPYNDYRDTYNNNWLAMGLLDWVINADRDNIYNAFSFSYFGYIMSTGVSSYMAYCSTRPTFYLSLDVKMSSGIGTKEDPYRIEI